ncbi:8671_t:CDS:2 [Funneliformis caledonium]|uniref:8671_t:CDS:1 n=1 Tax=Funneliformis caledonium TaxID=1117310 RepID=A0A9N9DGU6_9GLOM|nr:8671_t:CDS:2 [Funneliformis caledonium]
MSRRLTSGIVLLSGICIAVGNESAILNVDLWFSMLGVCLGLEGYRLDLSFIQESNIGKLVTETSTL